MKWRNRTISWMLPLWLTSPWHTLQAAVLPLSPQQCSSMQTNGVMSPGAPVSCDRLRTVTFQYRDFSDQAREGRVVVLDIVSHRVQSIFDTLYRQSFRIDRAELLERYGGDDKASMSDNNTSAFNARPITAGSRWSLHAYGVAIDINPRQNPYIAFDANSILTALPTNMDRSAPNRLNQRPDKPQRAGMAEDALDVFADNGFFSWGGYWNEPIDYQHFEIGSRRFVEHLVAATPADARQMFEHGIRRYRDCMTQSRLTPHERARADCVARIRQ